MTVEQSHYLLMMPFFNSELGWSLWGSLGWTKTCCRAELEDAGLTGLWQGYCYDDLRV